jgi:hypothetical protein
MAGISWWWILSIYTVYIYIIYIIVNMMWALMWCDDDYIFLRYDKAVVVECRAFFGSGLKQKVVVLNGYMKPWWSRAVSTSQTVSSTMTWYCRNGRDASRWIQTHRIS